MSTQTTERASEWARERVSTAEGSWSKRVNERCERLSMLQLTANPITRNPNHCLSILVEKLLLLFLTFAANPHSRCTISDWLIYILSKINFEKLFNKTLRNQDRKHCKHNFFLFSPPFLLILSFSHLSWHFSAVSCHSVPNTVHALCAKRRS